MQTVISRQFSTSSKSRFSKALVYFISFVLKFFTCTVYTGTFLEVMSIRNIYYNQISVILSSYKVFHLPETILTHNTHIFFLNELTVEFNALVISLISDQGLTMHRTSKLIPCGSIDSSTASNCSCTPAYQLIQMDPRESMWICSGLKYVYYTPHTSHATASSPSHYRVWLVSSRYIYCCHYQSLSLALAQ